MKKMILIAIIAVFYCSIAAQGNNHTVVPQRIKDSFSSKYPLAHFKKWKRKNDNYVAQYYVGDKKYNAVYSANANWIMTERKIAWSWQLPSLINKAFYRSEFKKWKIFEMKELQTPAGKEYVIHVNDGLLLDSDHAQFTEDYELHFDENGTLVKKEKLE